MRGGFMRKAKISMDLGGSPFLRGDKGEKIKKIFFVW